MTRKNLIIAGTMIYACEGAKIRKDNRYKNTFIYAIELTNSKPETIQLFSKFLKEIINPQWEKVRGQVFLYPDHDMKKIVRFWSKISCIPLSQMQKTIILKQKNSKYKPNPLGTFKIRYNNKENFLKLQSLIAGVWTDAGIVV